MAQHSVCEYSILRVFYMTNNCLCVSFPPLSHARKHTHTHKQSIRTRTHTDTLIRRFWGRSNNVSSFPSWLPFPASEFQ